ncbi:hypothetical protein BKA61DRAFT_606816 [Leptodontidium sp. MPI-SDFR-AT-0119]|nr:hypothetical protein BKA61DRAFT_606816 [Leptodontidium sp. MPI-SDFR-AT-0119]
MFFFFLRFYPFLFSSLCGVGESSIGLIGSTSEFLTGLDDDVSVDLDLLDPLVYSIYRIDPFLRARFHVQYEGTHLTGWAEGV